MGKFERKMKYFLTILFVTIILLVGCTEKNPVEPQHNYSFAIYFLKDTTLRIRDILNINLEDLALADKPWLTDDDIDFYDWSSHCIYLKKDKSYFFPGFDSFNLETVDKLSWGNKPLIIVMNNKKYYTAYLLSAFSSDVFPQPDIYALDLVFYPRDIIHIEWPFGFAKDKRNNEEVKNALISTNLLHEGLSITIDSLWIENGDTATVKYKLTIKNNDSDNLYILDPDKAGTKLFNAFNNGPVFLDYATLKSYGSEYKEVTLPNPLNSYDPAWFTRIESKKSISRMITLKGYPFIPSGEYYCNSGYNNPTSISKDERILSDGRYWIGPSNTGIFSLTLKDPGKVSFQSAKLLKGQHFLPIAVRP